MKFNLRYILIVGLIAFLSNMIVGETLAQSCTKTSKGLDRCKTETIGGSMTIDNDPVTKRPVARYLTFQRNALPNQYQIDLLASTMALLNVTENRSKEIGKLWLQCMNDGNTIGSVETNGMTWSFSNPIDDICGIDILTKKERGRAY